MTSSEQITASPVVLLDYFSDPRLHRARRCTVLHHDVKLLNFDYDQNFAKMQTCPCIFFSCELYPFSCELV